MQPGWCQPVKQEFMENECEALPGAAYPGVRDNRSTLNTKTGYDDDKQCSPYNHKLTVAAGSVHCIQPNRKLIETKTGKKTLSCQKSAEQPQSP